MNDIGAIPGRVYAYSALFHVAVAVMLYALVHWHFFDRELEEETPMVVRLVNRGPGAAPDAGPKDAPQAGQAAGGGPSRDAQAAGAQARAAEAAAAAAVEAAAAGTAAATRRRDAAAAATAGAQAAGGEGRAQARTQ